MKVPYGTHNLFITCIAPEEKQFRGISRLLRRLSAARDTCSLSWPGGFLELSRRRVLSRVLVSGHGGEELPGFGLTSEAGLRPGSLGLPHYAHLYLMGCFQGREDWLLRWARESGIPRERVFGSDGETESALSTCLLLHLLEEGVAALDRWFPVWSSCNAALRPYFPRIRQAYARLGGDPRATLAELAEIEAVAAHAEFLAVIERHPQYLTGLA
jgi:hypothetical protein